VSTESAGSKLHHFPELDGFRELAILLVIVGHTLEKDFGIVTDPGWLGVLLFFALSGFLITGQAKTGRCPAHTYLTVEEALACSVGVSRSRIRSCV
jgi:peptidoglycan/LPS O-acetylase OafA/YrhL